MNEKQCKQCKKVKPLDEFGNRAAAKDGKEPKCKPCHNAYAYAWLKVPGNWEKHLAAKRKWYAKRKAAEAEAA